jgi:iron complex transport system substrate-binding protein
MKNRAYLFLLVAVVCTVGACAPAAAPEQVAEPTTSPPPTATAETEFGASVEDGVGNTIILDTRPSRIVSLAPSHTEMLFALDLADEIVGVTEYCNYPPEAAERTAVGSFTTIDLEQVVGLEPDLVLATTMHMADTVPALQEHGLNVFVIDPQSVSAVMDTISKLGELTGQVQEAAALLDDMQTRIDAVQAAVGDAERPSVFWELGPELYSAGPGSFINDLIEMAGGENVAAGADSPWPQLTIEEILLKDPDVIVLADHNYGQTAEMVAERPGWSDLRAVRDGNIVEITDDDIVSRPGPRLVDGLEFLAAAFHPEVFE